MKKNLANIITVLRIIMAVIMFFASTFSNGFYFLYTLCGLSDMADGFIARRIKTESKLGAMLDSFADVIFLVVVVLKIFPEIKFEKWIWLWIVVITVIRIINILSGYIMHGKIIMLHTYLNKLTGLLLFIMIFLIRSFEIGVLAAIIHIIATFAAIQEGHLIRIGRIED